MSYMSSPKHLPALYPVYIFSWNSPYYFHRSYFYSLTYITFIITSNILLHRLMSARPMFSKMSCHAKFTKHFLKIFYVSGFIVIDISISTNIPYLLSSSHNLMQNMDKSADPCVDFYTYACGNWPKIHPLPDDAVYYDTFAVLKQDIRLKIKNLLEQPIDASDSEAIITVKNFFFSCMNECKFSFNHDILISQGSMRLIDTVALGLYKKPKKLKKTAINGGKKKTKPSKKKTKPAESSKDEGYYCLFCLEPYSNSRPRETWIKFVECTGWAHSDRKGSLCSAVDIVGIDDDESKCISILALIDERKEQPLLDLLNKLGGWPVISQKWSEKDFNLVILMAKLRLFNNDILISEGIGPDKRNSSINVIQIDQSRLGMPVPDYFLSKGRHYKAYLQYMVETAMLLGTPKKKAEFEMTEVAEFETQLANITVKDEFRRDINKIYRKISIRQLRKEVPEIDWLTYFKILIPNLVGDQEEVVTFAMTYFKKFGKLVAKTKPSLNPPARWMKCTSYVNQNLGMAVGASFVKKYFSDESKEMALEMISEISESFTELLKNASWMDKGAKSLAMEKVEKITRNIGFPNFILNNTALDNYYSDVILFSESPQELQLMVEELRTTSNKVGLEINLSKTKVMFNRNVEIQPIMTGNVALDQVDRYTYLGQLLISIHRDWEPEVRRRVALGFPAGILQPPLYSQFYSRVLNYGGIGVVIGHEITHGFDDKGRQFDEEGNLNEWWQNDVVEKFENQTFCFIDQYDNYVVKQVNGLRTVGENIADNGGVKQSFLAYKKWVQKNGDEQLLPGLGLTNYQLFFLNYAQVWCGSGRTEAMVYRLKTGVHTPGQFRLGHP
ncbi:Neprilysin-4 [Nymphon striatum]|nr:Neprilysin-4 [Nymphon striatum]